VRGICYWWDYWAKGKNLSGKPTAAGVSGSRENITTPVTVTTILQQKNVGIKIRHMFPLQIPRSRILHIVLCCKDRAFIMKFYNDQCNAQVFNLFIYLPLPYMFRAFF
jgi:hypothetical protein